MVICHALNVSMLLCLEQFITRFGPFLIWRMLASSCMICIAECTGNVPSMLQLLHIAKAILECRMVGLVVNGGAVLLENM